MAIKRYLSDPALRGTMVLTRIIDDGPQPVARFRETWFHPQGGGQMADRGEINGIAVVHVAHGEPGEVDHVLAHAEGLEVGQGYPFEVDRAGRQLHARLHTAGHLLANVCEALFPSLRAVGGHHWPGQSRVDLEGTPDWDSGEARILLEQRVQAEIRADRKVVIENPDGPDRICRIGEFPAMGCGGTHVASAAQIGEFRIRSIKASKRGVRIGYELVD